MNDLSTDEKNIIRLFLGPRRNYVDTIHRNNFRLWGVSEAVFNNLIDKGYITLAEKDLYALTLSGVNAAAELMRPLKREEHIDLSIVLDIIYEQKKADLLKGLSVLMNADFGLHYRRLADGTVALCLAQGYDLK